MKKRVVAVLMAAVTVAGLLAGCGGSTDSGSGSGGAESTEGERRDAGDTGFRAAATRR